MTPEQERQERRELLSSLDASHDPAAHRQASELRQLYHDRQMGGLADDVYDSAMHQGKPPPGWTRLSEHPELIRDYASRVGGDEAKLQNLLQPKESGFRAEIYLPDPEVLGPGYKPVLAMKGSAGQVATAQGLRDTTMEDFLANNFPQAIGQRTDYYDRAMGLALDLKTGGIDFEITGHSLAGGMGSAASMVTGAPATTFNPAGVHPDTPRRFAEEHRLREYDPNQTVSAYLTQGEVLNDGLQINVDRMDRLERAQFASVLKNASDLVQTVPEGKGLLTAGLEQAFPPGSPGYAQQAVRGFVDRLAHGDTGRMLDELPLAVGQVHPTLESMTRDAQGQLIQRPHVMPLQALTEQAKPLVGVLSAAGWGAHAGQMAGEHVRAAGGLAADVQGLAGQTARTGLSQAAGATHTATTVAGVASRTAVEQAGHAVAGVRQGAGAVEAGIDHMQGRAAQGAAALGAGALRGLSGHVPGRLGDMLDQQADRLERAGEQAQARNQQEASHATATAARDAASMERAGQQAGRALQGMVDAVGHHGGQVLENSGRLVDGTLEASAGLTRGITAKGPLVGAGAGAVAGAQVGEQWQSPTVFGKAADGVHAAVAIGNAKGTSTEAIQRHLMTETVLPSLDHHIEQVEQGARAYLHKLAPDQARPAPAAPAPTTGGTSGPHNPDDPAHPQHAMLEQIRSGVRRLDAQAGKPWDQASEQLSHSLLAACRDNCTPDERARGATLAGNALSQVDHVMLGKDGRNAFAVEGALDDPSHRRAHVEVQQAIAMPVEQSDRHLALANQAIAQEQSQAQQRTLQQGMDTPSRAGLHMA